MSKKVTLTPSSPIEYFEEITNYIIIGGYYDNVVEFNKKKEGFEKKIKEIKKSLTPTPSTTTANAGDKIMIYLDKSISLIEFINKRVSIKTDFLKTSIILNPVTPTISSLIRIYPILEENKLSYIFTFLLAVKLAEFDEAMSADKAVLKELTSLSQLINIEKSLEAIKNFKVLNSKLSFFIYKQVARFREDYIEVFITKDITISGEGVSLLNNNLFKDQIEKIRYHYFELPVIIENCKSYNQLMEKFDFMHLDKIKKCVNNQNKINVDDVLKFCKVIRKYYTVNSPNDDLTKNETIIEEAIDELKNGISIHASFNTDNKIVKECLLSFVFCAKIAIVRYKCIRNSYKDFSEKIDRLLGYFGSAQNQQSVFMPFYRMLYLFEGYLDFLQQMVEQNQENDYSKYKIDLKKVRVAYNSNFISLNKCFTTAIENHYYSCYNYVSESKIRVSNIDVFCDSWYILPVNYQQIEKKINFIDNKCQNRFSELYARINYLTRSDIDGVVQKNVDDSFIKTESRLKENTIISVTIFASIISFIITTSTSFNQSSVISRFDSVELILFFYIGYALSLVVFTFAIYAIVKYDSFIRIIKGKEWLQFILMFIPMAVLVSIVIFFTSKMTVNNRNGNFIRQSIYREVMDSVNRMQKMNIQPAQIYKGDTTAK